MSAREVMSLALAKVDKIERRNLAFFEKLRGPAILEYEKLMAEIYGSYNKSTPVEISRILRAKREEFEEKRGAIIYLLNTLENHDFFAGDILPNTGSCSNDTRTFCKGKGWKIELSSAGFVLKTTLDHSSIAVTIDEVATLARKDSAEAYLQKLLIQRSISIRKKIERARILWTRILSKKKFASHKLCGLHEGTLSVTFDGFWLKKPGESVKYKLDIQGVYNFLAGKDHFGMWRVGKLTQVSEIVEGW